MIRVVLFDIDGTLIHTGGAGVKAFARAFSEEFGLHDGSENLKFAGRTDVSLVREFFNLHKVEPTPEHFSRFFQVYLHWLEKMVADCDGGVFHGVDNFFAQLQLLQERPAVGLLTGNIKRGAEIKLNKYGIWDRFAFGGFADDHEDRNCIAAAARERGEKHFGKPVRKEEVLVIGDTPLDIRCARAIGAKVLAVATGSFSVAQLREHDPEWAVEDLAAISAMDVLHS
ncbi:MAG: HAD family hydrolase [Limisphaerales bacterium]